LNPLCYRAIVALVAKEAQFSLRLDEAAADQAAELAKKIGVARAAILRMAVTEGLALLRDRFRDFPPPAKRKQSKDR
jgi:hypothetical protein